MVSLKTNLESLDTIGPFRGILKVYYVFGLWHQGPRREILRRYGFLLHIIFTAIFITSLAIDLFFKKTVAEVLEALFLTVCEMIVLAKVFNLLSAQQTLNQIVVKMESEEMQPRTREEQELFIKRSQMGKLTRIGRGYIAMSVFSHSCASLVALMMMLKGVKRCPYVQWFYGFHCSSGGIFFYLLYAYQLFAMTMHCLINSTTDIFISGIISNLCGQVAVLGHRLATLDSMTYTVICDQKMVVKKRKRTTIEALDKLKELVKYHNDILATIQTFQDKFQYAIFCQLVMSAILICTSAFQLSMMSLENIGVLMFVLTFTISMVIQIGVPSYFAAELTYECSMLPFKAYQSEWYSYPAKFQRELYFLILQGTKQIEIKAMGIIRLDLMTFQGIMNKAYSLFTLLKGTSR